MGKTIYTLYVSIYYRETTPDVSGFDPIQISQIGLYIAISLSVFPKYVLKLKTNQDAFTSTAENYS